MPADAADVVRHARRGAVHPAVRHRRTTLPIFEKFFLGGEYSMRGFDIRSVGPRDPVNPAIVTGGNKTLLFNAEYYINVGGPVRLLGFFDAGQVQGHRPDVRVVRADPRAGAARPAAADRLLHVAGPADAAGRDLTPKYQNVGQTYAFKTSTGLEVRFFMPVLNVPFRLIAAYNPSRRGVLNNNLQPTPKFTFRFAVGTTF